MVWSSDLQIDIPELKKKDYFYYPTNWIFCNNLVI